MSRKQTTTRGKLHARRFAGAFALPVAFRAAAAEGELPRIDILAYNGGVMTLAGAWRPVVIEVSGMKTAHAAIPILRDHDAGRCLGHTESVANDGRQVKASAVLSVAGPERDEVVQSAANGFPWQASVSIDQMVLEEYEAGVEAEANGQTFAGPVIVARQSRLFEISIVSLGADADTSARLAAMRASLSQEGTAMTFSEWLKEKGFVEADLTADQIALLMPAYEADQKKGDGEPAPEDPASAAKDTPPAPAQASAAADPAAALRASMAAETQRIAAIQKLEGAKDHADIVAKAIGENWSAERAENALLKAQQAASRPGMPAFHAEKPGTNDSVAAGFCLRAGMSEDRVAKAFSAQAVDSAKTLRRAGLRHILSAALAAAGRPFYGYDDQLLFQAAMSTVAVKTLIGNVIDKLVLNSYEANQPVAFDICRIRSVSNFQPHIAGRILGPTALRRMAPGGEPNVSQVGEATYSNRVYRFAEELSFNYEMVRNDDVGAIQAATRDVGNASAVTFDNELMMALAGATFFTSANYVTGADTVFGATGLSKLWTLFRTRKDGPSAKKQKPVNVRPKFLLVPPALELDAKTLLASDKTVGGSSNVPDANIWKGMLELRSMPQLQDSDFTGNSETAFFLLADPNMVGAFELSLLDGVRTPQVAINEAKTSELTGITLNAWIDLGIAQAEPQGIAKSKGAA